MNATMEMTESERNAKLHAEMITEFIGAIEVLGGQDPDEPIEVDGETFTRWDELWDRLYNKPLSVEGRSSWYSIAEPNPDPVEYRICLTTGGPACQIRGEIGLHGVPDTAILEHQDWGTPWTPCRGLSEENDAAILAFAQGFYFGD